MLTHPGVYCLAATKPTGMRKPCGATLTDLEASVPFPEVCPIYQQSPAHRRSSVYHVLAYQLVQVIRRRLRQHGQSESWTLLRRILNGQQRITATFRRADDCALHVRKATVAETAQREIYQALGISESKRRSSN